MLDKTSFAGRKGIVTGAASGIGRGAALELAGLSARVALVDLNQAGLDETAAEIKSAGGEPPLVFARDASDPAAIAEIVTQTAEAFGGIDFLVNSAGILRRTAALEIPKQEWDLMISVNLTGPFLFCQAVAPHLVAAGGGGIVNVASLAGRTCSVLGGVHYTTAKHGMVGMSRHLARELGPSGIRVNAFCPGGTITPMIQTTTQPGDLEALAASLPRRQLATPREQGRVIAFLLSDASANIMGAAIDSNGGALMI